MKVIFNADDFGLTKGVNTGIVEAHVDGVVKSTTMMVGMSAEQHAVELARQFPELKIGLHLRFTAGKALNGASSLTDEHGVFKSYHDFFACTSFNSRDIFQEVEAQIRAFLQLGLPLSHIDSHHHAHTHPQLNSVIEELARQYSVPLRGSQHRLKPHVRYCFSDSFYESRVDLTTLIDHLLSLKKHYDIVEVMCHPARIDLVLRNCSSYLEFREKELSILTSDWLSIMLAKHGIEITDYSALTTG